MADLSISSLFAKIFGYQSDAFEPDIPKLPTRKTTGKYGSPLYAHDDVTGREYYLPMQVEVGNDVMPGTNTTYAAYLGFDGSGKWNLPHPVVSASRRKLIIRTPLTERQGSVKEVISSEDWQITVRGVLIGANGEMPEEQMDILTRLDGMTEAVTIHNAITDILLMKPERKGSKQVVINNLQWHDAQGIQGVRGYELQMESDMPFNLIEFS
jgi:hypothetical protein